MQKDITVSLLIDEIHLKPYFAYKGGNVVGLANNTNEMATSAFAFMLSSELSNYKDVFANGPGDLGSIPGRVIPKTLKMELDTTLLNTQHYKVQFKGKVEQSREWSSALPYTLV